VTLFFPQIFKRGADGMCTRCNMTEKDHVLKKKDEKMHCVSICLHLYPTFLSFFCAAQFFGVHVLSTC
jgi:hypothetical protein